MKVQITADALVVIRATSPFAGEIGMQDPYAHHFVTDQGKKMAEAAQSIDPIYASFNLARYKWFENQLIAAARTFRQVLVLGSGYDFRPAVLPDFQSGNIQVYEIDFGSTLESKWALWESSGANPSHPRVAAKPSWIHPVAADLSDADLIDRLRHAGFTFGEPTFVMIEGVLFFLPKATGHALTDPRTLRQPKGSTYVFDFWTSHRIATLNHRLLQETGKHLFRDMQVSSAGNMAALLRGNGFTTCEIIPLEKIAIDAFKRPIRPKFQNSWLVATATV